MERRIMFCIMLVYGWLILTGSSSIEPKTEAVREETVSEDGLPEEILSALEETAYTDLEVRQYEPEKDRQDFETCNRIFDEIEQGDWSGVVKKEGCEYFWGAHSGEHAEGISFVRTDVNGDGMPELLNCYENYEGKLAVNFIFAYTKGKVELIMYDLHDPMEFYFLGKDHQLLYEYGINGGGGRVSFSLMAFDENWEAFSRCTLSLYCFIDSVIGENNRELYEERYQSTYGTWGNGLYCVFRQTERPKKGIKGAEYVLSAAQFEEAYRKLTGHDFKEKNESWILLLGDCSLVEGEYVYTREMPVNHQFGLKLEYELKLVQEEGKYFAYVDGYWSNSFSQEKESFLSLKAKVVKIYDSYGLYFIENLSAKRDSRSFQPQEYLFCLSDYAQSGNRLAIKEDDTNIIFSLEDEESTEGYFVRRVNYDNQLEEDYPYLQAYRKFIADSGSEMKGECPIRGYYLEDLNFDQIPELGVLYETRRRQPGAAQYDYLVLHCFNGKEVVPLLTEDGEQVKIHGQAQILLDREEEKTYLFQEITLSQYEDSDHGYLKIVEEKEGLPYVRSILDLAEAEAIGLLDEEDNLLAEEGNEDNFYTRLRQDGVWGEISNAEYLRIKREYIPLESDFANLWNTDICIAGEENECGDREDEKENNWIPTKKEIDVLFWRWIKKMSEREQLPNKLQSDGDVITKPAKGLTSDEAAKLLLDTLYPGKNLFPGCTIYTSYAEGKVLHIMEEYNAYPCYQFKFPEEKAPNDSLKELSCLGETKDGKWLIFCLFIWQYTEDTQDGSREISHANYVSSFAVNRENGRIVQQRQDGMTYDEEYEAIVSQGVVKKESYD